MSQWKGSVGSFSVLAFLLLWGLGGQALPQPPPALPAPTFDLSNTAPEVRVTVGKSFLVTVPFTIKRISVAEPAIADVMTISSKQFVFYGKAPGVTNVVVWDDTGKTTMFHAVVQGDAKTLAQGIKKLFPKEEFSVEAVKDTLVISGVTESAAVKETVGQVAESFAPKKVINLLQVGSPPKQVSLKVQIAEVSRTGLRELGFNFIGFSARRSQPEIGLFPGAPGLGNNPSGVFRNPPPVGPDFSLSNLANLFLANSARDLGFLLRALEAKGDLRTLAEPRLVTVSGQKASFLAGGEIPIPVPQAGAAAGSVTIEFKPFGVRLDFTPKVLGDNRMELKLAPEVSEVDPTLEVVVSGFKVPGFTKRRAETTLELTSGETFAVAGLIQHRSARDLGSIPWVAEVPILGQLFTSEKFQRRETELLILITPELVRSVPLDEPLPLARGVGLGRGM